MKFDAAAPPPADLKRCDKCGKAQGYKGYYGSECMCHLEGLTPARAHSISGNPPQFPPLPNRQSDG